MQIRGMDAAANLPDGNFVTLQFRLPFIDETR
jgi:hypothetical protein